MLKLKRENREGFFVNKNLLIILFASIIISVCSSAFASMAMTRYGINKQINKQINECSEFFMGDECVSCKLPQGWEIIEGYQCPEGFEIVQKDSVCTPGKDQFCCTIQHSGAGGD